MTVWLINGSTSVLVVSIVTEVFEVWSYITFNFAYHYGLSIAYPYLDAYDTFSNDITAMLDTYCRVCVTRVYVDAAIPDLETFLTSFAAIVCGPGPGHPTFSQDFWSYQRRRGISKSHMIPVLGM